MNLSCKARPSAGHTPQTGSPIPRRKAGTLLRLILSTALLARLAAAQGQSLDPSEYVYPVLDVSGLCSANFGEMRPGHFHAGVDIKTEGVEGKRLVAVADGYVSRVVITAGGYGRAIYLTLRNGKTAVYGHAQRFRDDIEKYVREERYRRGTNDIDLSFESGQWPVRQGDLIGYSGNSGSSMGPHLHFELRDATTQKRRNLVHERIIRPKDDLPPRIMRLHYIEVDTVAGVPVHGRPESYAVVRNASGGYRLTRSEAVPTGRNGYFVVEVTDRRNGVENRFGIWRVTASIDGVPYFEYRMDGFTYEQARFCDAVSYYPLQLTSRNEVFRLAQLAGAPDAFYTVMTDRGAIRTAEAETHRIRIEAEDDSGNCSQLEFTVRGRAEQPRPEIDPEAVVLRHDRAGFVHCDRAFTVHVPAGALYEPIFCHVKRSEAPRLDTGLVALSPLYEAFDLRTPLYRPVTCSIRTEVPHRLQLRAVAARISNGKATCLGGHYVDGAVRVETRTTGAMMVVADTLPPVIRPRFARGAHLSQTDELRFGVSDNFSGIVRWSLHIDGAWVPCDRFPIKGILVHKFDTPPDGRTHRVELRVTDGCGNTARWEGTFLR